MEAVRSVDAKVRFPESRRGSSASGRRRRLRALARPARAPPPGSSTRDHPRRTASPASTTWSREPSRTSIPRYKTMTGYRVPRKGGWDCHGLPVELEVEKEIGTKGKRTSRRSASPSSTSAAAVSVQRYVGEFERLTERIGFRIDLSDAYWTMATPYIESVWWSFNQLRQGPPRRGRQGHGVLSPVRHRPVRRRGRAGLSTVDDPSVFVRFPIAEAPDPSLVGASLVVWTTTPWTLPSNRARRWTPGPRTSELERDGERFVVAEPLAASSGTTLGAIRRPSAGPTWSGCGTHPPYPNVEDAQTVVRRRVRLDARRDRDRAPRAGVRSRRSRGRARAGMAGVQAGRRRRPVHRRGARGRSRALRQGRRPLDRRRPARSRPALAQGPTSTPTRSAGAAPRRCCTSRGRRGTCGRRP